MALCKSVSLAALLLAALPYSVFAADAVEPPPDFAALTETGNRLAAESKAIAEIPKIRLEALKEAALGYGMRSGLARRSYEINLITEQNTSMLDTIYNFTAMVLDRNVISPVLEEAGANANLAGPDTFRVADATYRIQQQAKFITVPPTWRDYLMRDFKFTAEPPPRVLLPKNDAEKLVWQEMLGDGWKAGVEQANQIFQRSLSRLERDYKGMILYKSLLARGMISKPYVAEAELGITGDGNAININDRILRITAKPQLETNPAIWKPIVAPK